MKFIAFVIAVCIHMPLSAQSDLRIIWDENQSSIANAENLLSIHQVIYQFSNQHLKTTYWDESSFKGKALGIGYRLTKTILLDYQVDYLAHLYQHEVFGHGYRFREYGFEDNSYNINAFLPYGSSGGFAAWGTRQGGRLGVHENIAVSSGGMEASTILAKALRNRWLFEGEINYRESLLYISTFNDYTGYIWSTRLFDRDNAGNDVNRYLRQVNVSYGFPNEALYALSLNDISNRALVNFANTFQLFALYTYLKTYLYDAEETFEYPMISINELEYLPAIRFGLTPFGSEFIFENFIKTDKEIAKLEFRIGDQILDQFWGGGIAVHKSFSEQLQLGISVDGWQQPAIELSEGFSTFWTESGFGGRVLGEISLHTKNDFPIGLYSQFGYKTTGFIEGEQLDKGLILRLGLSVRVQDVEGN